MIIHCLICSGYNELAVPFYYSLCFLSPHFFVTDLLDLVLKNKRREMTYWSPLVIQLMEVDLCFLEQSQKQHNVQDGRHDNRSAE